MSNHSTTSSGNAGRKSLELNFSSGGEKGKRTRPPRKKETFPNFSFEDSLTLRGKRKSTSFPHSAEKVLKSTYSHSESLQKTIESVSKGAGEMKEKAQMVERASADSLQKTIESVSKGAGETMKETIQLVERDSDSLQKTIESVSKGAGEMKEKAQIVERELNQDLKEIHKSSPEKTSHSRGHTKKYNAELVERLHYSMRQSSKRSNGPSKTDSRDSIGEDPCHSQGDVNGAGTSRNKSGEKKRSRSPGSAMSDEIEPNLRSKNKRSIITPKKKPTASTSTTAALPSSNNPLSNITASAIIKVKAKKLPQPPSSTITSSARDSSPSSNPSMPILMSMVNSSSPPEDRELIPREIPALEPPQTSVNTKTAAKLFLPSLFQKARKLRVPKSPEGHTLSTKKVAPLGNRHQIQIHPSKGEELLSVSEESAEDGKNAETIAGKNSNTLTDMQNSTSSGPSQQNNQTDILTQPQRSDSVGGEEECPQGEKEPEKPKKTGKIKLPKSKDTCEIVLQTAIVEGGVVDQGGGAEEEGVTNKVEKNEESKDELFQKIQFTATPDEACEIDPFSFESVNVLPNVAISTSFYNSMVQRVTTPPKPTSFSPSSVASTASSMMEPSPVPGPSTSMMPPPKMRPPRTPHVKKTLPNPQSNKSSSSNESSTTVSLSTVLGRRPTRPEHMSTYQLLSDPNIIRAGLNLMSQLSNNQTEVEEAGRRLGYDVRTSPAKRRSARLSPDITDFGKKIKEDLQDEEEDSGPRRRRSANKVIEQQTSAQQQMQEFVDDAEEDLHEEGEVYMRELLNRSEEHSVPYQPEDDEFDLPQRSRSIYMTSFVQDYPRKNRDFKMHSKNIEELSYKKLISHFNRIKEDVKDVYDGKLPSYRQMLFNQGFQSRGNLHELILSLPFTNQQATHIIQVLYEYLFPDKDNRMKVSEYVSLVALPETFRRIYARVNNISIKLAETEMRFGGVYEEEVGGYEYDDDD